MSSRLYFGGPKLGCEDRGQDILVNWTMTQVVHNSTHKVPSGAVTAKVPRPHLGPPHTHTHTDNMPEEGGSNEGRGHFRQL